MKIIVFDLGGGTFDVTLLNIMNIFGQIFGTFDNMLYLCAQ